MSARPDEAIATLHDFTRCLDPGTAIVDRRALEEVLEFLSARSRANSIVIHHIEPARHPAPVVVMDGGRCRHCGAPR